ncbi:BadF/BadG/BcrA/BcrD ATPase family protein [Nocardioides sp. YIM 152315]|uniref:N-acetylglucosamine kinase n=1 Tax=Nocardioides sp. YIM 152315 TaxID=3031760 RepID=UPI0023D9C890|nr:BadF/BadG/BcrA/BcrD ATPase family protein [Nocardioides sp. YIM 152315]MDF1605786.1 BadF/BadG/BcrA/BcrD ATPase family protein [Nocardioides sp. YIM 152315]
MTGLVLGVDVGNSKTHVAVADNAGVVVGAAAGTGWMSGDLTVDTAVDHVLGLVERACGRRTGFDAAAIAMAGLDLPEQEREMADRFAAVAPTGRSSVVNDTFALLRAGSPTGEGIAVVAGAGINCVGVRGERVARFHSLGRLSGDWGGGYDVGAEALALACRAEDGRGDATALERLVPRHFGLDRPLQVSEAVLAGTIRQDQVLDLCPLVFTAATDGDAVARSLVERQAEEVVAFVTTSVRRLGWESGPVPVVLGGGLLQSRNPVLLDAICTSLDDRLEVTVSDEPPVVGSLLMALDLLGVRPAERSGLATGLRSRLG